MRGRERGGDDKERTGEEERNEGKRRQERNEGKRRQGEEKKRK